MASIERLRNANACATKEKRLRSLARRAGDLMVKSYDPNEADNQRAKHFLNKMNRILWALCAHVQGSSK